MVPVRQPGWISQCRSVHPHTIKTNLMDCSSDKPLVSVIIPVWNEEKGLPSTLASLANQQTRHPFEVIFVNNNSSDSTQDILNYHGVQSIFEPVQSIPIARQAGLDHAKGKLILCGDGDTLYPPNWIETMVDTLNQPGTAVVFSRYSFLTPGRWRFRAALYECATDLLFHLRRSRRPWLNAMSASLGFFREQALAVGGFDSEASRGSDGRLAASLLAFGRIKGRFALSSRVWTDPRRIAGRGKLLPAFLKRVKRELCRFQEYI